MTLLGCRYTMRASGQTAGVTCIGVVCPVKSGTRHDLVVWRVHYEDGQDQIPGPWGRRPRSVGVSEAFYGDLFATGHVRSTRGSPRNSRRIASCLLSLRD